MCDALKDMPPYDEDDDVEGGGPAAVERLREALAAADAVLFATPETTRRCRDLKNSVDLMSRPIATNVLRNKPVAVVGASLGVFGAVWVQAEFKKVLGACGARVTQGGEVPVGQAQTRFDDDGRVADPQLEAKRPSEAPRTAPSRRFRSRPRSQRRRELWHR